MLSLLAIILGEHLWIQISFALWSYPLIGKVSEVNPDGNSKFEIFRAVFYFVQTISDVAQKHFLYDTFSSC